MIVPVFLPHIGCGQRCAYCNQDLITNDKLDGEADTRIASALTPVTLPVEVALYGGNILGLETGRLEVLLRLFEPYRDKISRLRISAKPGTRKRRDSQDFERTQGAYHRIGHSDTERPHP